MDQSADSGAIALPPLDESRARALLAPPEVPSHATGDVALALRAAERSVPLLVVGHANSRPLLSVRALHALAHRPGRVLFCSSPASLDATSVGGDTCVLLADQVDARSAPILEACLDAAASWLVVMSSGGDLPAPVRARLGAATLHLPSLAGRPNDVPALAGATLARLAAAAGIAAAEFSPAALAALAAHDWPGGRVELERVVQRAFLLATPGDAIDVDHVDLRPAPAPPGPRGPGTPQPITEGPRLEYLLAELAHELRNPLVTVKTFAQQLPALLDDEALRSRFAELTDEAVERMDTLLENVLGFARLGVPRPESLDLGAILDGVLGSVAPALTEREVQVHRVGTGARCAADPEHLRYALGNLLLGITHETPPRSELTVDTSVNGVVSLRFGTGAAVTRLRDLAAPAAGTGLDDPTFLPLSFTLARAVLERTGADLGFSPDLGGQATVTVRLPPPPTTDRRGETT